MKFTYKVARCVYNGNYRRKVVMLAASGCFDSYFNAGWSQNKILAYLPICQYHKKTNYSLDIKKLRNRVCLRKKAN